jgi:hypothetical protein
VKAFQIPNLKIPQTGWNEIVPQQESPLLSGLPRGAYAYFNHGYYCAAGADDTLATTDYGGEYPSIVGRGRVYGIQCHPEKSQHNGTQTGYDLELTRTIAEAVPVPVIASGGAGRLEHFAEALTEGKADAALAASLFHDKVLTIGEVKAHLIKQGLPVRPVSQPA